jgi:ARG and Rhodanese-Phosphatase-superfamily-associated Protein domain
MPLEAVLFVGTRPDFGGTSMSKPVQIAAIAIQCACVIACQALADSPPDSRGGQRRLSGPFCHENLTVFLIRGQDQLAGRHFLTLQQALAQKKAVIRETKSVNELSIQNISGMDQIFVQSGDIIKGGDQDRMIAMDMVLPPRAGAVSLRVFCVEHGRWYRRGNEPAATFSSSTYNAPLNKLKLAARMNESQDDVWAEVSNAQLALAQGVAGKSGSEYGTMTTIGGAGHRGVAGMSGGAVDAQAGPPARLQSALSPSSLQLTLENPSVRQAQQKYIDALNKIATQSPDAIGCAYAVNGKILGADIYGSRDLFLKTWPVLLRSMAIEAVAQRAAVKNDTQVTSEEVNGFLDAIDRGTSTAEPGDKAVVRIRKETDQGLMFETRGRRTNEILRQSYVAR